MHNMAIALGQQKAAPLIPSSASFCCRVFAALAV